jgi:hypothetical protein
MFSIIPTPKSAVKRAVPPWEINGRGTPVSGNIPSIDAMFIKACIKYIHVMPTIKYEPKESLTMRASLNPRTASAENRNSIILPPIIPSSSPMTANIESPIGSGKKLNFCMLCPYPRPNGPPLPIAMSDYECFNTIHHIGSERSQYNKSKYPCCKYNTNITPLCTRNDIHCKCR